MKSFFENETFVLTRSFDFVLGFPLAQRLFGAFSLGYLFLAPVLSQVRNSPISTIGWLRGALLKTRLGYLAFEIPAF